MSRIIEKFMDGEFVVNCRTEDQARKFVDICYDNGIEWYSLIKEKTTHWSNYEEETCYRGEGCSLNFGYKDWYKGEYEIITFDEFMEECEMKEFKYKVGDCVKFERDEFKSIGKIVEIRAGVFNDEYLIELPKESHGDGHNGNGYTKGNYKEDNYWFIDDSDIECKVDGSEFESTKEEIKVAKFKVGDRVRANALSNDKYNITNLRNKYEGVVKCVYEDEKFKTEDGYCLEFRYFDLIEEPKHKTEFIELANEDIKVKDQFLYDHKVKTNGDIVFNKVKMLTLCFVKYNHWGKVYTFINPTGKVLKEGTKVLVDSAGRNDVAYVVSSVKVQAKHVDGLVYAMTGKKHLELKNVLGVYEVKTVTKETEVLDRYED